jgi:hypothetical protein
MVKICANRLPSKTRCDVCLKPVEELIPFDENDDENDILLVRRYRPRHVLTKTQQKTIEEYKNYLKDFGIENLEDRKALSLIVQKYGEKGRSLLSLEVDSWWIEKYWECKDCIVLDDENYYKVKLKAWYSEEFDPED